MVAVRPTGVRKEVGRDTNPAVGTGSMLRTNVGKLHDTVSGSRKVAHSARWNASDEDQARPRYRRSPSSRVRFKQSSQDGPVTIPFEENSHLEKNYS